MTGQELHAALNDRRQALGLAWWQVAIQLDIAITGIHRIKDDRAGADLRRRATAWLERSRR